MILEGKEAEQKDLNICGLTREGVRGKTVCYTLADASPLLEDNGKEDWKVSQKCVRPPLPPQERVLSIGSLPRVTLIFCFLLPGIAFCGCFYQSSGMAHATSLKGGNNKSWCCFCRFTECKSYMVIVAFTKIFKGKLGSSGQCLLQGQRLSTKNA